jgi:glycerophosphoryl diester phosphodiesterase
MVAGVATAQSPLVVGHRGAGDLCAHNTLYCYQQAIEMGATALEADLQVLGDGSLVMFHDDNALRQTGVDKDLLDMTLEEFKALDMGDGHPGLSFQEFLAAFPQTPVLLDVKPESAAMSTALLAFPRDNFDDNNRQFVFIKSNDWLLPWRLRRLSPQPNVAFSKIERALLLYLPFAVEHLPASWIDLEPKYLNKDVVTWAQKHGHRISASTIDEVAAMRHLFSLYALDGIVTNRPDLLRALITEESQ